MSAHADVVLVSAAGRSPAQIADIFNRGFEGYFVPVAFTPSTMATWLTAEQVDLGHSFVVRHADDQDDAADIGLLCTTVRGHVARLSCMGIAASARGKGVGKAALAHYVEYLRERVDRIMLEVIDKNDPAIYLYEQGGFVRGRHLTGYEGAHNGVAPRLPRAATLEAIDPERVREQMLRVQDPNAISWSMDARGLPTNMAKSIQGWSLGPASCLMTPPKNGRSVIRAVVVDAAEQNLGWASALLATLMCAHEDVVWKIPEIIPDDVPITWATRLGLEPTEFGQWEMCWEQ